MLNLWAFGVPCVVLVGGRAKMKSTRSFYGDANNKTLFFERAKRGSEEVDLNKFYMIFVTVFKNERQQIKRIHISACVCAFVGETLIATKAHRCYTYKLFAYADNTICYFRKDMGKTTNYLLIFFAITMYWIE